MSKRHSPIIHQVPSENGKPSVTYRYAGDAFVLIEYGDMESDLGLNFFVQAVDDALRKNPLEGLIETAPGFRSILVSYDTLALQPQRLLEHLEAVRTSVPGEGALTIPSRRIRLPIAFDDPCCREAVERYIRSIRSDAPNTEDGTNIEYIVRYNGLEGREELYSIVEQTELWVAFVGFFPGLPFMFPLDPRREIFVPKYNPTRTWTAEGTVGIGGPCYSIYPVESPGGYQLIGRTLPIYDLKQRNRVFRQDPILVRPADRIRFHPVSTDELLDLWEQVHADRYRYDIEDGVFDVSAYLEQVRSVRDEAEAFRRRREAAAAATPLA